MNVLSEKNMLLELVIASIEAQYLEPTPQRIIFWKPPELKYDGFKNNDSDSQNKQRISNLRLPEKHVPVLNNRLESYDSNSGREFKPTSGGYC